MGIMCHLGRVYQQARDNPLLALQLAMQPGITGAEAGPYGAPDNAGAGLFVTRSIAKGTGGYFLLLSGRACYRLYRSTQALVEAPLSPDPFADRSDKWEFDAPWEGTVVSLEIRTEQIIQFQDFFASIRDQIPRHVPARRPVRFT